MPLEWFSFECRKTKTLIRDGLSSTGSPDWFLTLGCMTSSLPADVRWGSFVTHSFLKGRLRGGYIWSSHSILHAAFYLFFYHSVTRRCEPLSDIWNIHKKAIQKKSSQHSSCRFSCTFCPDFVNLYNKPGA